MYNTRFPKSSKPQTPNALIEVLVEVREFGD